MTHPMERPETNPETSWCVSRFRELTAHLIDSDEDAAKPATRLDFEAGFAAELTVLDEYFERRWPVRDKVQ
jgi:hypothetical protein